MRPSYVAYCTQIPLFHPNTGHGNHQRPWLSSTQYTHLTRCHGRGTKLRGAQRIVHPRTTLPRPYFSIPSRPRRPVDGSSLQTRQQGMPHATPQQITSYNHFSHNSAMISNQISCDPIPESQSQDVGAYSTFPGQYDPQVSSAQCPAWPKLLSVVMQIVQGLELGHTQRPCIASSLLKDRIANIAFKVFVPKRPTRDAAWLCPVCSALLGRSQDRRRHILSHLPHWVQCPDTGCSWRGDRWETLNRHRHNVHPSSSQEPDKNIAVIYNPWPLVRGIIEGTTLIEDARAFAISVVERRAFELGKSGLWGDFWGRKGRKGRQLG